MHDEAPPDDGRSPGRPLANPTPVRGGGRPRRYNKTVARRICRQLVDGKPLAEVCADPALPSYSTVMLWLAEKPEFQAMYARARALQAHALADEILGTVRSDDLVPADKQARIRGLAWMAGRLNPVRYSDKAQPVAETDAEAPVFTVVVRGDAGRDPSTGEEDGTV